MAKSRLGWLGPAIVIVGAAVAGLAIWFMQSVRPEAGSVIDTIPMGAGHTLVVRNEAHSNRSMLEVRKGDEVVLQALIPHYAGSPGRPAVAWSDKAVTVRVTRDGRAEVFAFALTNSQKLGAFRLAVDHEPITTQPEGPLTLSDHVRSYELVGGSGWHQIIAVDIVHGGGVWKADLGPEPVTDGGVSAGSVWIQQGARRRTFNAETGLEIADANPAAKPLN